MKRLLIILGTCLLMLVSPSCSAIYTPKIDVTGNALDIAFQMQLEYNKGISSIETYKECTELRIKTLEDQNNKQFWIIIATIVGTAAVANSAVNTR